MDRLRVPATLTDPHAGTFWLMVVLTGAGTGACTVALTQVLKLVQDAAWPAAPGTTLLDAAAATSPGHRIAVLAAAGLLTGLVRFALKRLASGNGIDITEAIWFKAGRLPALRTLASALLSIVIVGMGASLGREGAPKQAGAVVADGLSALGRLTDDQRRLLVACGAGAGMAAAYGVPLGGALFAVEVLRGALALRLVLPALLASLVATGVSWLALPDAPTYVVEPFKISASGLAFALVSAPVFGVFSVGVVRAIAWADRAKPRGWLGLAAPVLAFAVVGATAVPFPQLLGNGKDLAQLLFSGAVGPGLVLALLLARPLATLLCYASGAPGGLFTPSLATGALLGGALGQAWTWIWPGAPEGLCALVGAGALLAATTQGPLSAVVLMLELTGRDRSFVAPLFLAVVVSTLVSRTLEQRSVYEARLTDDEVAERLAERDPGTHARARPHP